MPPQTLLVDRLRALLANEHVIREVSMFGGRSFLVNEKMVVSALTDGGLLVRVATDQHEELLSWPGAVQAEMGTGRAMGPGWIKVLAPSLSDAESLAFWVRVALERNRAVTGGR